MNKEPGFTLLELMATITIGALLLALALPNYSQMVKNNCLTTGANALVSSFQLARSEAVTRYTEITITADNSGDNANEWGTGWTVTLEEDRNANTVLDDGEDYNGNGALDSAAVVRVVDLTCTQTTIDETANDTELVYDSDGYVDNPINLDICDDRVNETGRRVTLSLTGRPTTDSEFTGCS